MKRKKETVEAKRVARKRLREIFGKWFTKRNATHAEEEIASRVENEMISKRRLDIMLKLTKIKYMRDIKLDGLYIANKTNIALILYEEALRGMNEHSMRLLLEHSLNYIRHEESDQSFATKTEPKTSPIEINGIRSVAKGAR